MGVKVTTNKSIPVGSRSKKRGDVKPIGGNLAGERVGGCAARSLRGDVRVIDIDCRIVQFSLNPLELEIRVGVERSIQILELDRVMDVQGKTSTTTITWTVSADKGVYGDNRVRVPG